MNAVIKRFFLWGLTLLGAPLTSAQILTQSNADGSILITPKGVQGSSNSGYDTTNVGLGSSALHSNTFGIFNTAIGTGALNKNTTGGANTANGTFALFSNGNGVSNTATGFRALYSNTGGNLNTANGSGALYSNLSGHYNTAVGASSINSNTSGESNTGIGYSALFNNTTADGNTALGAMTLYSNTTGDYNTAVGTSALYSNTYSFFNTATGYFALSDNSEGIHNTAIGARALSANFDGDYNTVIGSFALSGNYTGNFNTAIGVSSGSVITTGNSNIFIGHNANASSYDLTNATAIGANITVNASNKMGFGNDQVTIIEGTVPFSTPSDRRLKQNIIPSLLGLPFITRLVPVSYTYIADKTNVRHDGLIAQDVEKVMQELGVEFSGLQKSPDGMYSLAYSDFVMPLVNAAKELKQQNDKLMEEVIHLKQKLLEVDILKKRLDAIEASLNSTSTGK